MSEHEELTSYLARIDTKLDLIMTALSKTQNIEFQIKCREDCHRIRAMKQPCNECGGYDRLPVVKVLGQNLISNLQRLRNFE